jgi:flagellar biosynthetic protein FliR
VALPPAAAPPAGDAAMLALSTMGKGFGVAVQIAAPFIVFGVIINLGLGVLSRLMPALQVFFLGMPATIMIGFVILAAVIGMMMGQFLKEVSDFLVPLASR